MLNFMLVCYYSQFLIGVLMKRFLFLFLVLLLPVFHSTNVHGMKTAEKMIGYLKNNFGDPNECNTFIKCDPTTREIKNFMFRRFEINSALLKRKKNNKLACGLIEPNELRDALAGTTAIHAKLDRMINKKSRLLPDKNGNLSKYFYDEKRKRRLSFGKRLGLFAVIFASGSIMVVHGFLKEKPDQFEIKQGLSLIGFSFLPAWLTFGKMHGITDSSLKTFLEKKIEKDEKKLELIKKCEESVELKKKEVDSKVERQMKLKEAQANPNKIISHYQYYQEEKNESREETQDENLNDIFDKETILKAPKKQLPKTPSEKKEKEEELLEVSGEN